MDCDYTGRPESRRSESVVKNPSVLKHDREYAMQGKNPNSKKRLVRPGRRLGAIEQLESRCLMAARIAAGIWTIAGDDNPQALDDDIVIGRNPANPAMLQVTMNGAVIGSQSARRVREIRVLAGLGNDTVTVDESLGDILVRTRINGGAGNDELGGGSGRDSIDGGPGRDSVYGGDGADRLHGGADGDRLEGGDGNDRLMGDEGNDTAWGGAGDDQIVGADGRDRLHGGDGRDRIAGGTDNDTLVGNGDDPSDLSDAGFARAATDAGPSDNDQLDGGPGDNVIVGSGGDDVIRNGRAPDSLEPINSCAEVVEQLAAEARNQYGWYFGGTWGRPLPGGVVALDSVLNDRLTSFAGGAAEGGNGDSFSTTNTQELGVDEADIVKTDGSSIFILRDGEFIVVDALPAADAAVLSRTEIEGYAIDMFLRGNRVMIFSSVFVPFDDAPPDGDPEPLPDDEGGLAARIAPDFWFPTGTQAVKITVLDVSDPAAPTLVHESTLDGSYINARAVDGQVYVVLNNSPRFVMPYVLLREDGDVVESPEMFAQRLSETDPATFLPQFRSVDYTESGTIETTGDLLVDCGDLYKTPDADLTNLTSVLSFDLDADTIGGPVDSATVFGYVSTVYASAQNLYLVQQNWHRDETTAGIHKIALGDDIEVVASGEVPGTVLNQFSLDEEGDYFRIATTSGNFGGTSENNVFVLSQEGDTLNVVGSIENLAPGERIFSARFFDEVGFVVTFRQVDPLFALDLSDPTDPQVAGELKIPGYSSYLHPVDGDADGTIDHLLAIGRDADENGRVRGLQVSLFDVSDLTDPSLVDQYLIQPKGGWSWSAAEWDHHAFGYFPEFDVLSIPVSGGVMVATDDGDPETIDFPTFEYRSDFWVFQVDVATGFELLGQVEHSSEALRSLRIGEVLYTLARDNLKAQPIVTPSDTTADVSLEP
jgi:uncharacterized secreted protein with C-terminal beta-propeller domain